MSGKTGQGKNSAAGSGIPAPTTDAGRTLGTPPAVDLLPTVEYHRENV
jgi:hypothetical protein